MYKNKIETKMKIVYTDALNKGITIKIKDTIYVGTK